LASQQERLALEKQRRLLVLLSVRLQSFRFLLLPKICQGRRQGPQVLALKWPQVQVAEQGEQVAEQALEGPQEAQRPQGPQVVRKPLEPQERKPLEQEVGPQMPLGVSSETTNPRCLHAPGQAFPCSLT